MRKGKDHKLERIIDANFNRSKEGLRVCEDICRYVLDAKQSTRKYKNVRHRLSEIMAGMGPSDLIRSRNIEGDVGRSSTTTEFKRRGAMDIYFANSQRVKESIRVLEEFAKLKNKQVAEQLKQLRYKVYALEKSIIERS